MVFEDKLKKYNYLWIFSQNFLWVKHFITCALLAWEMNIMFSQPGLRTQQMSYESSIGHKTYFKRIRGIENTTNL